MTIDLDGLRADLSALATKPHEIPPEQLPDLVADLARVQALLLLAATRRPAPVQREAGRPEVDRLLKADEAAALLGVTPQWLYRRAARLPFMRRISRKIVRFSQRGLERWLASRQT